MNKLFSLFLFLMFLSFAPATFAQQKWKIYHNARYGYSISYPADLLKPGGEADNGDGQRFSNRSIGMNVYGTQMLLNETLLAEFNDVVEKSETVSYKVYRPDFFVVSGVDDGHIFYQKTIQRADGTFATFYIQYGSNKRAVYDKITARIAKSFK